MSVRRTAADHRHLAHIRTVIAITVLPRWTGSLEGTERRRSGGDRRLLLPRLADGGPGPSLV